MRIGEGEGKIYNNKNHKLPSKKKINKKERKL